MEAVQVQHKDYLTYSQWNIADAIITVTTFYSNYEFYDAMARKCKRKWRYMQEQWESGNYVMSRQSLTFFVQLGNNYTCNSQNSIYS